MRIAILALTLLLLTACVRDLSGPELQPTLTTDSIVVGEWEDRGFGFYRLVCDVPLSLSASMPISIESGEIRLHFDGGWYSSRPLHSFEIASIVGSMPMKGERTSLLSVKPSVLDKAYWGEIRLPYVRGALGDTLATTFRCAPPGAKPG